MHFCSVERPSDLPHGLRRRNSVLFPENKLEDPVLKQAIQSRSKQVHDFMLALSLCHTVNPIRIDPTKE